MRDWGQEEKGIEDPEGKEELDQGGGEQEEEPGPEGLGKIPKREGIAASPARTLAPAWFVKPDLMLAHCLLRALTLIHPCTVNTQQERVPNP